MAGSGVKLAMGDPKAMALGRTSMDIIKNAGLGKQFLNNVAVYGATVNQLTLYVVQGAVDAAIVARANAFMHRDFWIYTTSHKILHPGDYRHRRIEDGE